MYKKFLYPIVKCKKLKSWIKYWILSIPEKAKGIWSEILTGSSFTLENSLESVFNKFDLKGNTSQNTTTGKNKLAYTLETLKTLNTGGTWNNNVYTWNGITFTINDDLSIKANGTATSGSPSYLVITNNPNLTSGTEYKLNGCPSGGNVQTYALRMYEGTSYISQTGSDYTFSYSNQNTIRINIFGGATTNNLLFKPMIRLSSATDTYEPYTGGIASPNPDYPQVIQNVSGNNTITISNADNTESQNLPVNLKSKNLLNIENPFVVTLNRDITISLPAGTYTMSFGSAETTGTGNYMVQAHYTDNTNGYFTMFKNNKYGVLTLPKDIAWLRVYSQSDYQSSQGITTTFNNLMLNTGSTATTYEPYWSYELSKIGTSQDYFYKDSGKWYIHKEIGKVVLAGTEAWVLNSTTGTNMKAITTILTGSKSVENSDTSQRILANNSKGSSASSLIGTPVLNNIALISSNRAYITINSTTYPDIASWKTFLNSNNMIVYFELATPTNTEITETSLINQLEAILQARSYNNQTNISQTNEDLPFIIDLQYLMEEVTENA